jgi:C-3',4' desaturase CrtD
VSKIVVVGAGVAGATTAALLAKAGHQVTLLEAHIYPGGCAGTFFHQKYLFDAGATLAGGFQPGGPHDVVGKQLGINWKIKPAEPAWRVYLPDHTITRFGCQDCWHGELERVFAHSPNRDHVLRFFKTSERISDAVWDFAARQPTWPPSNIGDLFRTAAALRPDTLPTLPLLFETMGNWAWRSGMSDRTALLFLDTQLLISAQTTAPNASALFGAAAADLPRKGVNHVIGGIGTLSKQLVDAFKDQGGVMHYRQEVTRFETRDGRIVAAHTKQGERFECDYLVANLTPWDMARLLGDASPAALQEEARTRPDEFGAFTLYLGVEDHPGDAEQPEHHQVVGTYDKPLGETNSIFMSFSMPGDTTRAPAGHRALTISTHTRAADWWKLRETPGAQAEYDERVKTYADAMLAQAEHALPGLRARIRLQLEGTPVTFKFYTKRHRGGVGGFPFTSIFKARGPWTGMRNAWLVGDSIFPGQSTAGVTMGALRVVGDVKRALGKT